MSFLLPDDDQQATLAVALALIDSCESVSRSKRTLPGLKYSTSSTSETSSSSELRTTDDEDDDESSRDADKSASLRVVIRATGNKKLTAAAAATAPLVTEAPPDKRHTVGPQPSAQRAVVVREQERAEHNGNAVTRHRARKRAEFASLKAELVALEATLARLKLVHSTRQTALSTAPGSSNAGTAAALLSPSPANDARWMDVAAVQARERQESETLNQKLKDALEKQTKVTKALEAILGNAKRSKNTSPIFFVRLHVCMWLLNAAISDIYWSVIIIVGTRLAVRPSEAGGLQ